MILPKFNAGRKCEYKEFLDALSPADREAHFSGVPDPVPDCTSRETAECTLPLDRDASRRRFLCSDHFVECGAEAVAPTVP